MHYSSLIASNAIHNFEPIPVEEDKVLAILSSANKFLFNPKLKPWHFVVIQEPMNILKFSSICYHDTMITAPLCIVICGEYDKNWWINDNYCYKYKEDDVILTANNMRCKSMSLGLETTLITNIDTARCKQLLKLPDNIEPVCSLAIGYVPKKDHDEINETEINKVHWENFSF